MQMASMFTVASADPVPRTKNPCSGRLRRGGTDVAEPLSAERRDLGTERRRSPTPKSPLCAVEAKVEGVRSAHNWLSRSSREPAEPVRESRLHLFRWCMRCRPRRDCPMESTHRATDTPHIRSARARFRAVPIRPARQRPRKHPHSRPRCSLYGGPITATNRAAAACACRSCCPTSSRATIEAERTRPSHELLSCETSGSGQGPVWGGCGRRASGPSTSPGLSGGVIPTT